MITMSLYTFGHIAFPPSYYMKSANSEAWKIFSISSIVSYIVFNVLKFSMTGSFVFLAEFILATLFLFDF